jgi:hypothetical protein
MTGHIESTMVETRGLPEAVYLHQLQSLGAWWCLGSSDLDPGLLTRYGPAGYAAAGAGR